MSLLRARGVGANVGEEVSLANVDLEIAASDRICLTGRNGAGKSTFLAILAGLRASQAAVLAEGRSSPPKCFPLRRPVA